MQGPLLFQLLVSYPVSYPSFCATATEMPGHDSALQNVLLAACVTPQPWTRPDQS